MTEQEIQQQVEEAVARQLDNDNEALDIGTLSDIPLERCDITISIQIENAGTLGNAIDSASLSLARYGLSSFYILATDTDTGREWIINDGRIDDVLDLEDGS